MKVSKHCDSSTHQETHFVLLSVVGFPAFPPSCLRPIISCKSETGLSENNSKGEFPYFGRKDCAVYPKYCSCKKYTDGCWLHREANLVTRSRHLSDHTRRYPRGLPAFLLSSSRRLYESRQLISGLTEEELVM